ncbi:MAG: aminoacyl-tRNA hydrolase [Chromatiales bacterium]|nr:aminoacyl-tRNA hydrolase [Chromatiales bacterium]
MAGTPLQIIAGLGNPGREYAAHPPQRRVLVRRRAARRPAAQCRSRARAISGEVAPRRSSAAARCWLLKPADLHEPQRPARSRALARLHTRSPVGELLVVHDELDLPPGTARLKLGGGHGGHNGLRDIIAQLRRRTSGACGSASATRATSAEVIDYVLQRARRGRAGAASTRRSARRSGSSTTVRGRVPEGDERAARTASDRAAVGR